MGLPGYQIKQSFSKLLNSVTTCQNIQVCVSLWSKSGIVGLPQYYIWLSSLKLCYDVIIIISTKNVLFTSILSKGSTWKHNKQLRQIHETHKVYIVMVVGDRPLPLTDCMLNYMSAVEIITYKQQTINMNGYNQW